MALPTGSDYDLDAGLAGLLFRQELNAILEAIISMNASSSLPPQTFPFMLRADESASPNELQIRNPADSSFLKFAEITDTLITLFSDGAAVPSLGVAQTFTESQTIDQQSTAGVFSVGSDLSSGVVARIPLFGHNANGTNVTGVNLVCRITTNTAGAEDFTFELEVVRAGTSTTVLVLGSTADFSRSGGGGTVNADIIQQDGVNLDTLLDDSTGIIGDGVNFATNRTISQGDQGTVLRYNGAGNATITLPRLTDRSVVHFINEGTGDLTFASDTSPDDVEFRTTRTVLPAVTGQSPICSVLWFLSGGNRVTIVGQNVEP